MASKVKKATKKIKKATKHDAGLLAQAKVANAVALEVGEDIVDLSLKGAAASQKVLRKVINGGVTIFGMQQKFALDILEKVVSNEQLQKMVQLPLNYFNDLKEDATVIVDTIKEEAENAIEKITVDKPTAKKVAIKAKTKKVATKKAKTKKVTAKKVTAKKAKTKKVVSKKDDLTKIKGIGPKVAQIFADAGYRTYAKLANAKSTTLKKVLAKAGTRYSQMDPAPWIEQAVFAADNDWAGLKLWNKRG